MFFLYNNDKENIMERDQVVCRCLGTTWGQIEDAIEMGATNYQEVFSLVKFGVGCGGCRSRLKQLIMNEAWKRQQAKKEGK